MSAAVVLAANSDGRHCRLTLRPDSRQQKILKRKRILVITLYFVQYRNEEKPQNFSKETTLATIIDTATIIYRYRYMFLWDIFALTFLLEKNRARKIDHVGPVTG